MTRGKKKAEYILISKSGNLSLAIVEAKDNKHSIGSGMQQAMEYARILDIPLAYSRNGDALLEHGFFNFLYLWIRVCLF